MRKKMLITLCMLFCIPSVACTSNSIESASTEVVETSVTEVTTATQETITQDETMQTEPTSVSSIMIVIQNSCGADLTMISTIDPNTNKQFNIGALTDGSHLTIEWPAATTDFYWAVYGDDGNKLLEATTDVSNVNKRATITLTGEGAVTDATTKID